MLPFHRSSLVALALLTATSFAPAQEKAAKPHFDKTGSLTDRDPRDKIRGKSYSAVHPFKIEADRVYRIDLTSDEFDPYLRVEDADGKALAADDDGAGDGINARLIFRAPRDGELRLVVTTYGPAETGKYHLVVSDPTKIDLFAMRTRQFTRLPVEERVKLLEDVVAHLDERGKKATSEDADFAVQLAETMQATHMRGTADWCLKLSRALAVSENERVQGLAKLLEGIARRVRLIGNTMTLNGTLVDGKTFDWSAYRGKVVLVDFWATWCGPCVKEMPELIRLYNANKEKGFEIVGISLDREPDRLAAFIEKRKLPWACIHDKDAKIQPLADYYGVTAIPLAFLVDRQGKVVSIDAGGPGLGRMIEELLEAK